MRKIVGIALFCVAGFGYAVGSQFGVWMLNDSPQRVAMGWVTAFIGVVAIGLSWLGFTACHSRKEKAYVVASLLVCWLIGGLVAGFVPVLVSIVGGIIVGSFIDPDKALPPHPWGHGE